MYTTNSAYGNAIVLAAYAELPEPLFPPTIPGYLQPWLGMESPTDEQSANVPAFIWGRAARTRRHRAGRRNHTLIGAPWLYLLALEKAERIPVPPIAEHLRPEPPEPGRVLYFPHHGMDGDLAAARKATHLAGEKGLTVALTHEQAASRGTVEAYTSAGLRVEELGVATAEVGSVEPFYLQHLLALMRAHQQVRTDHPSAYALFAQAAGLPVDAGVPAERLARLTRDELGTDAIVPPQELRALFDWSTHV